MQIGLVSCTKSKRKEPASPRDLYDTSALFRKARKYAESHHDEWYILSAKHHVLDPDGPEIEPYDVSVTDYFAEQRREWAEEVYCQLSKRGLLDSETTFVVHAGKVYYEYLLPYLEDHDCDVEIPTEGLQIGETMAWYNERND